MKKEKMITKEHDLCINLIREKLKGNSIGNSMCVL